MGQGVSSCPLQVFRDGQVILWLSVKAPAIRIGVAPVSRHRRNVQNIRNIIGLAYLICFASPRASLIVEKLNARSLATPNP